MASDKNVPYQGFFSMIGGDPEFFFTRDGEVIGSEKVLPPVGISGQASLVTATFIRDGVQAELNWNPAACFAHAGNGIAAGMRVLKDLCIKAGVQPSFSPSTVTVGAEELASLSPASRRLGCMPSENLYEPGKGIGVNPDDYPVRSAGGHIHIALYDKSYIERLVCLLDVIVGNTMVLIDRDPRAAERRQVYGRAGEFRRPAHGLEYRTLSNFWLRSYTLTHLIVQMSRWCVGVAGGGNTYYNPTTGLYEQQKEMPEPLADLMSRVDVPLVIEAINTNNAEKARVTWEVVREWIRERMVKWNDVGLCGPATLRTSSGTGCWITPSHIDEFDFFLSKPLDHWWPAEETLDRWCEQPEAHSIGWGGFLETEVRQQMLHEREEAAA